MRTSILVVLALLFSHGAAYAGTPFDDLSALYDQAKLPTQAELTAWYSGRCYFASAKDQVIASILAGQVDGADFKIIVIGHGNVPEDYYDQLTQASQAETTSYISSTLSSMTAAQVVEGSLASTFTDGHMEYRIRKTAAASGDEYLGRMVVTEDSGDYKKGDTFAMCRYFKKVK